MTDTISLRDIDGDLDRLSPEQARRVKEDARTDRACCYVMGWRVETADSGVVVWRHPSKLPKRWQSTRANEAPVQQWIQPLMRVSANPRAAHRAREWLRDQQKYASVGVACRKHSDPRRRCEAVLQKPDDVIASVLASTEMLATARLILVLYAQGEL